MQVMQRAKQVQEEDLQQYIAVGHTVDSFIINTAESSDSTSDRGLGLHGTPLKNTPLDF